MELPVQRTTSVVGKDGIFRWLQWTQEEQWNYRYRFQKGLYQRLSHCPQRTFCITMVPSQLPCVLLITQRSFVCISQVNDLTPTLLYKVRDSLIQ